MSLNTRPPDYLSMTRGQLQLALEKLIALKQSLSLRLPDCGEKLDKSIVRVRSILESKNYQAEQPSPPAHSSRNLVEVHPDLPADYSVEDDCDDLAECLDSLTFGNSKEEDESEDLSKFPERKLSFEEIDHLRRLCNLPRLNEECTDYHPFIFRVGVLPPPASDLVCLTVVDCRNVERRLTRLGSLSTWSIQEKPQVKKSHFLPEIDGERHSTSAASDAVFDFWRFIRSENEECPTIPILVADSPESLLYLRRLFCSLNVRHHHGARNGLPRNTRFVVDDKKSEVKRAVPSLDKLSAAVDFQVSLCLARLPHFTSLNKASLAALRPKSVAWIEAPLNLYLLRTIFHPPEHVATQPPYAATVAYPSPPIPQTGVTALCHADDKLLHRIACAGLSPRSLSLLAGQGKWRGFAGLLLASRVSEDVDVVAQLYRHFHRVHKSLSLNAGLYHENAKTSSTPATVVPWNPVNRHLKTLSMEESLRIMIRARDEYRASQQRGELDVRPTMPPASVLLTKYRDQPSEDDNETNSGIDSDDSEP
ncbi:unnamed protein product [Mesocestoides corti]|uniref:NARG2_C domain-containing protein n=1 Tax=Mesocestoides corti TaxID=53468 RepID=A0A0R3U779_MESCO|nr:unnamed protein product [Mesocestoides corti]